jgi:hypothetical protein
LKEGWETGTSFWPSWLEVLPERVERRQKMGEKKPSVDSLIALWNELSSEEQWTLVNSDNRPRIKTFLRSPGIYFTPSEVLAPDLIPEKWKVVDDVIPTPRLSLQAVEFISLLDEGQSWVSSAKMRERAKRLGADLGLADAKFFLEHQAEIQEELRGKVLVFPGTVLLDPDGRANAVCLEWSDGRWIVCFRWFDYDWQDFGRLVRVKAA